MKCGICLNYVTGLIYRNPVRCADCDRMPEYKIRELHKTNWGNMKMFSESKKEQSKLVKHTYPTGKERGKMKLPFGKNYGKIDLNNATSYGNNEVLYADKSEKPIMFIDIEHPRKEYKVMQETELHFGISANFKVNKNYGKQVKHIDIYFPLSQIDTLIKSLQKLRGELND